MEYIDALDDGESDCFLCRYRDQAEQDARHLVVWRGPKTLVVMNRFPYTGGHLLIAPFEHVGNLHDLSPESLTELMTALRDCQDLLTEVVGADGFNAGLNLGRCAGAGLPGHLHLHIVPRWNGDTNFMTVLGDVRVIPQSLESLYAALRQCAAAMNLPRP
jgi:ATP adenylyltransferase